MVHITIRCDAGEGRGMGHISRMLALAFELELQGKDEVRVTFATRTPEEVRAVSRAFEIPVYAIDRGLSQLQALFASITLARLQPNDALTDILIVDVPYFYPEDCFRDIMSHTRVVRIDHPWAEAGTANLLVLPNMHTTLETVTALQANFRDEQLLYGNDSVLLGYNVRDLLPKRPQKLKWPLQSVTFAAGGQGTRELLTLYNMTKDMSNQLLKLKRYFALPGAIAGLANVDLDTNGYLVGFDLERHIKDASLLVSFFGVTVYESLYLGTPVAVIPRGRVDMPESMADAEAIDQLALATDGAVVRVPGKWATMDRELLNDFLCDLIADRYRMEDMYKKAQGSVSGNGAALVASSILALMEGE